MPISERGDENALVEKEEDHEEDSTRLFDLSCLAQLEIPPVWANSNAALDVVVKRNRTQPATRRTVWSGPYGEEFALRHISVCHDEAEPFTNSVTGTSRRNGSGAIAC